MVVTDDSKRQAIADIRRGTDEDFLRAKLADLAPGPGRRRLESALYLLEHLHELPVHVLAYGLDLELEGLEGQPTGRRGPLLEQLGLRSLTSASGGTYLS